MTDRVSITTKLPVNQQLSIQIIIDRPYMTQVDLAAAVGVDQDTVARWRKDPTYMRVLTDQRELWEADLRDELLVGKRTRMRVLSDEIDELQKQRQALAKDLGEHVTVSKAITANVVAAGKEMQDTRLGGGMAGAGGSPLIDPKDPEFTAKIAKWLRKLAVYMDWTIDTITLEEVCASLESARPVEEEK